MFDVEPRVVFLLLFVVISFLKWLYERMRNKGQQPDVNEQLEDIYDDFREEIRRRQTTTQSAQAPPPVPPPVPPARQPAQVVRPQIPQQQPPSVTYQAPTVDTQAQFRKKVSKPRLSDEERAALARMQNSRKRKRATQHGGNMSIAQMLADPRSARKAIVLQEILGKPKSMQV